MTQPIPNPYGNSLSLSTSEERTWAVLGHLAALIAAVISTPRYSDSTIPPN